MKSKSPKQNFIARGASIRLSLKLLSKREKRLFVIASIITLTLAFLDLIGVLLIGVVTSLSLTGISTSQVGNRVSMVLEILRIDTLPIEKQVIVIGLCASIMLVAKTIASMLLVRKILYFMARRAATLSSSLVARFMVLTVAQINKRTIHTSIYALTDGVTTIMLGILGVLITLVADLALLVVLTLGLFIVDPITAVASTILFGCASYILYRSMHFKVRNIGEKQALLNIESSQRINESISAYRELLVRNRRGFYIKEISDLRYKLADGQAQLGFLKNVSKYTLEIFLVFSAVLLAIYQLQTTSAFRAIATIAVFIAASTRITPALLRIQQGVLTVKLSSAQATPTFALIRELGELETFTSEAKGLLRDYDDFLAEVKLTKVTFSYNNVNLILNEIEMQVSPGEFVAVVGSSGSGKSTLIDVMIGAIKPSSGYVKISGLDPQDAFEKWPGAVAYVPQDCPIVNGSIRMNLGLGFKSDEISDDFCWESLRVAKLEEFVRSLPNGLDSQVGDRGTGLSGGQKQRLGIARALITRPRILILDEATSSLDGLTEAEIARELRKLRGDLTLIVVAHRLSTILDADRIYYIKDGSFRGSGSFENLKNEVPEFFAQVKSMDLE